MRISPERRRRRRSARERSRFGRGGAAGGRDLVRFRRNREALWREVTSIVLWLAIALMLVNLATTLHRFAGRHLADRPVPMRLAFPAVALGAAVFCAARTRGGIREVLDIRREQRALTERLRDEQQDITGDRSDSA